MNSGQNLRAGVYVANFAVSQQSHEHLLDIVDWVSVLLKTEIRYFPTNALLFNIAKRVREIKKLSNRWDSNHWPTDYDPLLAL